MSTATAEVPASATLVLVTQHIGNPRHCRWRPVDPGAPDTSSSCSRKHGHARRLTQRRLVTDEPLMQSKISQDCPMIVTEQVRTTRRTRTSQRPSPVELTNVPPARFELTWRGSTKERGTAQFPPRSRLPPRYFPRRLLGAAYRIVRSCNMVALLQVPRQGMFGAMLVPGDNNFRPRRRQTQLRSRKRTRRWLVTFCSLSWNYSDDAVCPQLRDNVSATRERSKSRGLDRPPQAKVPNVLCLPLLHAHVINSRLLRPHSCQSILALWSVTTNGSAGISIPLTYWSFSSICLIRSCSRLARRRNAAALERASVASAVRRATWPCKSTARELTFCKTDGQVGLHWTCTCNSDTPEQRVLREVP